MQTTKKNDLTQKTSQTGQTKPEPTNKQARSDEQNKPGPTKRTRSNNKNKPGPTKKQGRPKSAAVMNLSPWPPTT